LEAKPLERAVSAFKGNLPEGARRGVRCAGLGRHRARAAGNDEAFGKVHVVCDNGGVSGARGADNILLQDWRWVIDINLTGVVHGVKALLPLLKSHGEGGPRA
jgi:NAD(P)-dependent dehydrogenase (short-subunit alcohol dehydrogenase family)